MKACIATQALAVLEEFGVAGFSTRRVSERADVTAPTLYHHFGDADGLIGAAVALGFEQFLRRKLARPQANDPAADLMEGWDDYVAFARERPTLYAAMAARLFSGAKIAAAEAARANLVGKLEALARLQRLALPVEAAFELVWSTSHAAAMLHVAGSRAPAPTVVETLRRVAAGVGVSEGRE